MRIYNVFLSRQPTKEYYENRIAKENKWIEYSRRRGASDTDPRISDRLVRIQEYQGKIDRGEYLSPEEARAKAKEQLLEYRRSYTGPKIYGSAKGDVAVVGGKVVGTVKGGEITYYKQPLEQPTGDPKYYFKGKEVTQVQMGGVVTPIGQALAIKQPFREEMIVDIGERQEKEKFITQLKATGQLTEEQISAFRPAFYEKGFPSTNIPLLAQQLTTEELGAYMPVLTVLMGQKLRAWKEEETIKKTKTYWEKFSEPQKNIMKITSISTPYGWDYIGALITEKFTGKKISEKVLSEGIYAERKKMEAEQNKLKGYLKFEARSFIESPAGTVAMFIGTGYGVGAGIGKVAPYGAKALPYLKKIPVLKQTIGLVAKHPKVALRSLQFGLGGLFVGGEAIAVSKEVATGVPAYKTVGRVAKDFTALVSFGYGFKTGLPKDIIKIPAKDVEVKTRFYQFSNIGKEMKTLNIEMENIYSKAIKIMKIPIDKPITTGTGKVISISGVKVGKRLPKEYLIVGEGDLKFALAQLNKKFSSGMGVSDIQTYVYRKSMMGGYKLVSTSEARLLGLGLTETLEKSGAFLTRVGAYDITGMKTLELSKLLKKPYGAGAYISKETGQIVSPTGKIIRVFDVVGLAKKYKSMLGSVIGKSYVGEGMTLPKVSLKPEKMIKFGAGLIPEEYLLKTFGKVTTPSTTAQVEKASQYLGGLLLERQAQAISGLITIKPSLFMPFPLVTQAKAEKQKGLLEMIQITEPFQRQKQWTGMAQAQVGLQEQIQIQIPEQTLIKIPRLDTPLIPELEKPTIEMPPIYPEIIMPEIIMPPPIIPITFLPMASYEFRKGFAPFQLAPTKRKYVPSLTALMFDIRGKQPEFLTGLEIRPIISMGKKAKKIKIKKGKKKKSLSKQFGFL